MIVVMQYMSGEIHKSKESKASVDSEKVQLAFDFLVYTAMYTC